MITVSEVEITLKEKNRSTREITFIVSVNCVQESLSGERGAFSSWQILRDSCMEIALKKYDLYPASTISYSREGNPKEGSPFAFTASFDIWPRINLQNYKGIKIKKKEKGKINNYLLYKTELLNWLVDNNRVDVPPMILQDRISAHMTGDRMGCEKEGIESVWSQSAKDKLETKISHELKEELIIWELVKKYSLECEDVKGCLSFVDILKNVFQFLVDTDRINFHE